VPAVCARAWWCVSACVRGWATLCTRLPLAHTRACRHTRLHMTCASAAISRRPLARFHSGDSALQVQWSSPGDDGSVPLCEVGADRPAVSTA
jgi:hypothetical protein